MGRTEQQVTRRRAAQLIGRWLLIGWVLTGVVAMHVLAHHDPGGGHGMLMDPHAATASSKYPALMSMVGQDHHPAGDPAAAAAVVMAPVAPGEPAPSGSDMGGAMAGCILFLTAAVASVVVLLLLAASRRNSEGSSSFRPTSWQILLRGPPGPRRPRISLCVLRV